MADEPATPTGTAFGKALDTLLLQNQIRQNELSSRLGVSPAYISSLVRGTKNAHAGTVDKIADCVQLDDAARVKLHRAAATDMGFKLDLPDDF